MINRAFNFRVGCLLRWANSNPNATKDRQGFYRLKQAICETFGTKVGTDIQRIVHDCWECGGSGRDLYGDDYCYRCTDGIWEVVYVELERWEVGGKVFHRPIGRIKSDETQATINGKIKHNASCMAIVAALSLAKLFSNELYWRWLENADPKQFGSLVSKSSRLAEVAAGSHPLAWRLEHCHYMTNLILPPVENRR